MAKTPAGFSMSVVSVTPTDPKMLGIVRPEGRAGGPPLAKDDPLLCLENVVFAPHSSSDAGGYPREFCEAPSAALIDCRRAQRFGQIVNRR